MATESTHLWAIHRLRLLVVLAATGAYLGSSMTSRAEADDMRSLAWAPGAAYTVELRPGQRIMIGGKSYYNELVPGCPARKIRAVLTVDSTGRLHNGLFNSEVTYTQVQPQSFMIGWREHAYNVWHSILALVRLDLCAAKLYLARLVRKSIADCSSVQLWGAGALVALSTLLPVVGLALLLRMIRRFRRAS